jgi:carbon storage regulator CsrA
MLVLSRKVGEVIRIGDGIEVMVTKMDRGQVWLSFKASTEIRIMRAELIGREPKCASEPTLPSVAGASDSAGPDVP